MMPLLCHVVKRFFYIPAIFVFWHRATSQSGTFATATGNLPSCVDEYFGVSVEIATVKLDAYTVFVMFHLILLFYPDSNRWQCNL
jgi:hypothetical protein